MAQETTPIKAESKRTRYEKLRAQLEQERSSFVADWRDVNDYILPGRGRFYSSDINRRRDRKRIIDSTGTMAARTLSSGFMGGMTSPAREWKQLTTPDPEMAKWGPAKEWLASVGERMSEIHRRCGLYKTLPVIYTDLGGFGTGAMMVEEDLTGRVMRTHPFAIGSYYIANDESMRVTVFMRVFMMTVRQIVGKFGQMGANGQPDWSNLSDTVYQAYRDGNYENKIEVCHVVHPNDEYNPRRLLSKYKRYASCYYETGSVSGSTQGNYMDGENGDKFLSEKGYDFFPILAPRWALTDGDSYATDCPGFTAIGDVKSLQVREKMIARGEEKGINPSMVGSPMLKTTKASTLPGDITYDPSPADKSFRKAHDMDFRLDFSENKQEQTRKRVQRAFYENLFLSITNDNRNDRATAYELAAKKQEELVALGPVLENVSGDLLDPLVDISFSLMLEQGLVPDPPKELRGVKLGVRYVSIMAQAQKALGLGGIERFLSIAGNIAAQTGDPKIVTTKVNLDKVLDAVGDMTGIPVGLVRDEEEAQAIRDADAQQARAAAAPAAIGQGAAAVKDLAAAKTDQPSALTDLLTAAKAGQAAQ